MIRPSALVFSLALFAFGATLRAQSATGSIAGQVSDPAGAAIAGAKVVAKQTSTGLEYNTLTSEAGFYAFPSLPVGPYALTLSKQGFRTISQEGITVAIATRSTLDFSLQVGDVQQTISVTSEAPLLNTESAEGSAVFQPKFMKDAPLFVGGSIRNPMNFVSFMPGVNNGFQEGSIMGSSRRSQEILIDGASQVDTESGGVSFNFGSPEQFGEFKLITNTFNAEYGRTGGGIQVFVTRSGSNEIHGSAFNFLRNDFFEAAGWGVNRRRVFPEGDTRNPKKPKVRQNEYGFNAGGPVYIPKLYNGKNRTFFYGTYNGFKQAAGSVTVAQSLPTANMRSGDFSELAFGVFDPLTTAGQTRQPFPGNRIPSNRFSQISAKIVPLIPQPDRPGTAGNYNGTSFSDVNRDFFSFKFDHLVNDKHRANFFFSKQFNNVFSDGPLPGALTNGIQSQQRPEVYRVNYDYTITPSILNHFTWGLTNFINENIQAPANLETNWPTTLGLRGVETGRSAAFPFVQFGNALSGYGRLQTRSGLTNSTLHFANTLSWVKGAHEFKFGFDWRRQRTDQLGDDAGVQGVFTFNNFQTAATPRAGNNGYSFASFLLGETDNAYRFVNAEKAGVDARYGYRGMFAQDTWKLTRKLTLSLGIRWDIGLSREDKNGVQATFDPNTRNPATGTNGSIVFVGTTGENRIGRARFGEVYLGDIGPRIGLAYRVDNKTVIRGGYGLFYSPSNGLIGGGCFPCTFGVSARPERISDGFGAALNWDGGFVPPAGYIAPPNFSPAFANNQSVTWLLPEDGRHARISQWSFNIQRELPGAILFDAGYVGSYTDRLNSRIAFNQVDPKYLAQADLLGLTITDPRVVAAGFRKPYASFPDNGRLAQALRPYPQFLDISSNYNARGSSRYNGMVMKVEKRYSSLSLLGSYVFSRAQMYRGADASNCGCIQPQNAYDYSIERGLHTNDIPHLVNIIAAWDLPFGKGHKFLGGAGRLVNSVVSGWTLSGAQQYRAGNLLRVTVPNGLNAILFNRDLRPNVVAGQDRRTQTERTSLDPDVPSTKWFNAAAFTLPAANSFGNASVFYNDLRNPPVFVENLGIVKRTAITESINAELRADISNLFNRTLFGNINTNLAQPNDFGRPTGVMSGPRIVQLALRVNF